MSESEPGRRVRLAEKSRVDDVKEGEEEERQLTAVEERAEARARVMMGKEDRAEARMMMAASRLLPSVAGGEERVKMEEREPLESVGLVMKAGERPNGERLTGETLGGGEKHLLGKDRKEGRLEGKNLRLEGNDVEADSDRGSSVDTTDDSGQLFFRLKLTGS